jgi:ABC-2 type transport system ATP-binding protein
MITVKNLCFSYAKTKKLFNGLSWEIEKGFIYGLLGKNGAGKTTLMKILSGLLFPDNGNVYVEGFEPAKRHPSFLSKFIMIPEEFDVPPLTINNYEKIYAPFYKNFNHEKFDKYLKEFDLSEIKHHKLNNLSYGQKKKVLISFAFASGAEILILDEPTNGLDIPSKSIFRKLCIEAMDAERSFIISTHQVKDVERILDRITIIDNGRIISDERTEDISTKYSFKFMETLPQTGVIYYEKNLGGYKVMTHNTDDNPSSIDMELYFNAVIKQNS